MASRSVIRYVFNVLLSKLGPYMIRQLIWQRRTLLVIRSADEKQTAVYVHPLICLAKGFMQDEIVELTISFRTWQGLRKHVSRVLPLRVSFSVATDSVVIGRTNAYNILGREPGCSYIVDNIKSYKSLPTAYKITSADVVRLSAIKQYEVESKDNIAAEISEMLREPRILYNGDIICLPMRNKFTRETTRIYYKVICEDSLCIFDSSTTVYQIASVNEYLPYAGRAEVFQLPVKMHALVERMRNICLAYETIEEKPLVLLLSGAKGSGKRLLTTCLAQATHRNFIEMNCYNVWSEVSSQSEAKLKNVFEKVKSFQPVILHLASIDVLGYDAMTNSLDMRVLSVLRTLLDEPIKATIVFSCNSDQVPQLSPSLCSLVLYNLVIDYFDESDRLSFFSSRLPPDLASFAAKNTTGFVMAELVDLLKDVEFFLHTEKAKSVQVSHVEKAIDKRNDSFSDAIGAPKIPSVSWDEVGGLEETKRVVIESIEVNLRGGKLRRSGIIFFGPPGCGKTLLAKAVATEFKVAFLNVKGPELLNKYVGQSEENLRKVFERARQASPCVIFFDELDSLAPNRGRHGDSGGVMDRIVSQLLAELDSLHQSPHIKVFVMAATNRADLLDPALLTPGRFDKVIHVEPGTDVESKTKILRAVSKKVLFAEDVNLEEVAAQCDQVMSGAELHSIISLAVMESIREQIQLIEAGETSPSEVKGRVSRQHLQNAITKRKKQVKSIRQQKWS